VESRSIRHRVGSRRWCSGTRSAVASRRTDKRSSISDSRLPSRTRSSETCGSPTRTAPVPDASQSGDIFTARWSPDATQIPYTEQGGGGAYVVDVATGKIAKVLAVPTSFPRGLTKTRGSSASTERQTQRTPRRTRNPPTDTPVCAQSVAICSAAVPVGSESAPADRVRSGRCSVRSRRVERAIDGPRGGKMKGSTATPPAQSAPEPPFARPPQRAVVANRRQPSSRRQLELRFTLLSAPTSDQEGGRTLGCIDSYQLEPTRSRLRGR
jgi:hypothetical protein